MSEIAESARSVPRSQYKSQVPQLRTELLAVQEQLGQARFPTIIVFGGVVGAGKSETINLLNQWLDPRGIATHAFDAPSEEERERPDYWRYWLSLPPKGKIGMYLGGWYDRPLHDQVDGRIDDDAFDRALDRIDAFEQELVDDGALLIGRTGAGPRRWLELWCVGFSVLAVAYFLWWAVDLVWFSWAFDEISPGLMAIPLWIPRSAMALGA